MATDPKLAAQAALRLREIEEIQSFLTKFEKDRPRFAKECFLWSKLYEGAEPADYQLGMLAYVDKYDRTAGLAPRGAGKSTTASIFVIHWAIVNELKQKDWKVVTTASVKNQLTEFLWPEIRKMISLIDWSKIPMKPWKEKEEVLQEKLKLTYGSAIAVNSDEPDNIEGAHASALAYLFDESKAITDATFDATEGAFSNAGANPYMEAKILAISTPGDPEGRFFSIHKHLPGFDDWETYQITLQDCLKAGRVSAEWAKARKKQWGESDPRYIQQVLGQFPNTSTSGVIPLQWYLDAVERWKIRNEEYEIEGNKPYRRAISIDVADQGPDATVIASLYGNDFIDDLEELPKSNDKMNTMRAVNTLANILELSQGEEVLTEAVVDSVAIGAPVLARLLEIAEEKEWQNKIEGFVAGAKAIDEWDEPLTDKEGLTRFRNMRTAAWWNLRELLDPQYNPTLCLPDNEILRKELTIVRWREDGDNIIVVERKEDLRKPSRLGRSPDYADAVIMLMFATREQVATYAGFFVIG